MPGPSGVAVCGTAEQRQPLHRLDRGERRVRRVAGGVARARRDVRAGGDQADVAAGRVDVGLRRAVDAGLGRLVALVPGDQHKRLTGLVVARGEDRRQELGEPGVAALHAGGVRARAAGLPVHVVAQVGRDPGERGQRRGVEAREREADVGRRARAVASGGQVGEPDPRVVAGLVEAGGRARAGLRHALLERPPRLARRTELVEQVVGRCVLRCAGPDLQDAAHERHVVRLRRMRGADRVRGQRALAGEAVRVRRRGRPEPVVVAQVLVHDHHDVRVGRRARRVERGGQGPARAGRRRRGGDRGGLGRLRCVAGGIERIDRVAVGGRGLDAGVGEARPGHRAHLGAVAEHVVAGDADAVGRRRPRHGDRARPAGARADACRDAGRRRVGRPRARHQAHVVDVVGRAGRGRRLDGVCRQRVAGGHRRVGDGRERLPRRRRGDARLGRADRRRAARGELLELQADALPRRVAADDRVELVGGALDGRLHRLRGRVGVDLRRARGAARGRRDRRRFRRRSRACRCWPPTRSASPHPSPRTCRLRSGSSPPRRARPAQARPRRPGPARLHHAEGLRLPHASSWGHGNR